MIPPQTYIFHQIYVNQQKQMKNKCFEFRATWPGLAAMTKTFATWEWLGPFQVANASVRANGQAWQP